MKHRLSAFLIALIAAPIALCAQPPVAPPTTQPYAADRKLLASDFIRFDWTDSARKVRSVPVKIYFPTEGDGPFPVIIFSHGLGGTREAYEYLARQWTAHGYVVIHPQHVGSDDSVWRNSGGHLMQAMRQAASLQNAVDRAKDIHFVIDQLDKLNREDAKLKGKLDLKRIGMAGHSFGANTTMLVAGQSLAHEKDLNDTRVKCALVMSAPAPAIKNNADAIFTDVTIPVFLMTGTNDNSPIGETKAEDRRLAFDHLKHATYLLTFNGGDHMVFSGRFVARPNDEKFQREIRESSTAFWDAFLKDDAAAKKWLLDGGFKSALGSDGAFEQR